MMKVDNPSSVSRASQNAEPGTENHIIWTSKGNEYMALRPDDAQSDRLLNALRDNVLCTLLPPEDVDSIDTLRNRLAGKDDGVTLVAVVCGENLRTKFNGASSPVVKGGCLAELYTHPLTNEAHGHLTYLGTLPEHEGQGIGKNLIMARMTLLRDAAQAMGVPLRSVFIEVCNDNLENRAKFIQLGARLGPEGFCRPDVSHPDNIERRYRDMYYPVDGRYPDPETILEARACYWRAQGQTSPETHPDFVAMKAQMGRDWQGFHDPSGLVVVENRGFQGRLDAFAGTFPLSLAPTGKKASSPPLRKEEPLVLAL